MVDDPAGTPTNKKITIEKFFANVESTSLFANLTPASNSTTAAVVLNGGLGITKNLIVDGNVWSHIQRMRNQTSYTYDETLAEDVYQFVRQEGLQHFISLQAHLHEMIHG